MNRVFVGFADNKKNGVYFADANVSGVLCAGPDISTEELFTIFDDIRKMSYNMNDLICDFIGKKQT